MTNILRRLILLLVLAGVANSAIADSLEAIVDRQTISLNETLNFRLVYEGQQSNSDPDFSSLRQQFDVLSNQKSMQHSIINGAVSASTEWRLILAPKNAGQLLIPPFTFNGESSRPITITVNQPSKDPVSGKEDVFLETFVDKSTVYVQEQFIVTFRLYYNRSVESLDAAQPGIDDTRIEALPRVDYQKTLGHTTYGVAEYKYAIFADTSGTIEIPEQTWTVRTTDQPSMTRFGYNGGRYKLHRVKTKPLSITVKPKPDIYPAAAVWLPAQEVELSETWSQPPENFNVGEPITRTVTLRAEGAAAEQLAPIFDGTNTDGFKFYPDKPSQDTRLTERGVVGSRTESVAIVPSRSGELTLPPVEVTWWNTDEQQVERAVLPARTVTVTGPTISVPSADTVTAAQPPADAIDAADAPNQRAPGIPWGWLAVTAALLLSNATVLILLIRQRARRGQTESAAAEESGSESERKQFQAIKQACASQSPEAVRAAVLAWARGRWGQRASSLTKLGELSGDQVLSAQLKTLDAVLFAGAADTIDYAAFSERLGRLRKERGASSSTAELKPLYAR